MRGASNPRFALALAIALTVGPAVAQPPDWLEGRTFDGWQYGGDSDDAAWFSRPAVQPSSGFRRIWIRTENKSSEDYGVRNAAGSRMGVMSVIELLEVDCAQVRYRTLQASFYPAASMGGNAVTQTPDSPKWSYATPGTLGEGQVGRACRIPRPTAPPSANR